MDIGWEKVESSFLDALAHDGEETMFARMKGGEEYKHTPVSHDDYLSVRESPSVGRAYRLVEARGTRI